MLDRKTVMKRIKAARANKGNGIPTINRGHFYSRVKDNCITITLGHPDDDDSEYTTSFDVAYIPEIIALLRANQSQNNKH